MESGSVIGEVIKPFGKDKILVKVNPDGKYIVKIDKKQVKVEECLPATRVCLKSDNYTLHKILKSKVDPLISLMKVEKVPDSNYDMIGGCEK